VSIVTPSYNQARFLEETIRSVLLQGYPDIEYLILDGGSTDGSVELIRKYEPYLTYWVSERDQGQADAINRGWRRSTGDIIAYLNSDDVYAPGAIQRAVEYLVTHPEAVAVIGGYQLIDESGKVLRVVPGAEFSLKSELRGNSVCQPTVFIRRGPLFEVGLLDPVLHYVMDFELWLKLGLCGQIGHVSGTQALFRIVSSAKSLSQVGRFLPEILEVFERFFARTDLPPDVRAMRRLAYSDYYAHEGPNEIYRPRELLSPEQFRRMRAALWTSIRWYPLRRKTLLTLAHIMDSYLGTHVAQGLQRLRDSSGSIRPQARL
jgi:glycosyltransferase involved in cell wall biosynthesis